MELEFLLLVYWYFVVWYIINEISFPNVIVTSHQGFLTEEALTAISRTTLDNAMDYKSGTIKDMNTVLVYWYFVVWYIINESITELLD